MDRNFDRTLAEEEIRFQRDHYEWLAAVAPDRAGPMPRELEDETHARARREHLEWLAAVLPDRASEMRALLAAEDALAEPDELSEWVAAITSVDEGSWDASKHPRGAFPQNPGWWSPTGGAANASGSASFSDRIIRRNREVADLTGVTPPSIKRSGGIAEKLRSAGRLARDVIVAAAGGLLTGGKALINGSATAVKNVVTLGLSTRQLELIGVTDEDRANGYDTAVSIATASGEVLIAVGTGGLSTSLSAGGTIARAASGALTVFDAAGNAVGVVQGVYDATQDGVNIANGTQIAAGALGLGANAKAAASLAPSKAVPPATGKPYAVINSAHAVSRPTPKGIGPNGGRVQSHHGLQQEWAGANIPGYDSKLAPTVTIETGRGFPHTTISTLQNARRDARLAAGLGKWSSTVDEELQYIVDDFRAAGFGDDVIRDVLNQNYAMLDKLGVHYKRPEGF